MNTRNYLKYYIIYKPFGMLSQFSKEGDRPVLGELFDFPKDVYPVGRLDADSEGLLVLTNDKRLNNILLDPEQGHEREYWAQVEGAIDKSAMDKLRKGVTITVNKKKYQTKPCKAGRFRDEPKVPDRNPPIRFRKNIPTHWIRLSLIEGKNRQVRKMTAAVGFPTLRLIRYRIENVDIDKIAPGEVVEMEEHEIYRALNLR